MGRPLAEPRQLLETALKTLPDGATWRTVADQTGLPANLTRRTLDNMARSGAAIKAGYVRMPGVNRPAAVFKLPEQAPQRACNDLQAAMRGWVSTF